MLSKMVQLSLLCFRPVLIFYTLFGLLQYQNIPVYAANDVIIEQNDSKENVAAPQLLSLVHQYIDSYQQIEHSQCKYQRLMVMHFDIDRHEGFGSVAMALTAALGIALHSNRTLIWGLELPYLLNLTVSDSSLNSAPACNQDERRFYGGNFCYFFQLLSTCTLLDLTKDEIVNLGRHGYNYSSRVVFVEAVQRSISIFHPPKSLSTKIGEDTSDASMLSFYKTNKQTVWCAALASYVFRLKDNIRRSVELTRSQNFGTISGIGGVQIRHGDLLSPSTVHKSRKVFSFDQFAAATNGMLHRRGSSVGNIYISSDSIEVEKYFKTNIKTRQPEAGASFRCGSNRGVDKSDGTGACQQFTGANSIKEQSAWTANIIVLNSSQRYRPKFGAHIAAAGGACVAAPIQDASSSGSEVHASACAWNYDELLDHLSSDQNIHLSKPERVARVLYESIEDMYLLSHCEFLIAQGSSYFSTFSALLLLAQKGAVDATNRTVLFLDQASITSGLTPSGFLLGQHLLNGTFGLSADFEDMAYERWAIHTRNFISGVPNTAQSSVTLTYDPWSSDLRMGIPKESIFPQLPEKVFYREAKTWLGNTAAGAAGGASTAGTKKSRQHPSVYKPVWPGSCPGPLALSVKRRSKKKNSGRQQSQLPTGADIREYLTMVTNLGVDHYDRLHPAQAKQCWHDALEVITEARRLHQQQQLELGPSDIATLAEMEDVASGNIRAVVARPYLRFAANEYGKLKKLKIRSRKVAPASALEDAASSSISTASKNSSKSSAPPPTDSVWFDLAALREIDELNDAVIKLDEKRRALIKKRDHLTSLHLDNLKQQQELLRESHAVTLSGHDIETEAGVQPSQRRRAAARMDGFQCDAKRYGKLPKLPMWSWGFSRVCCQLYPSKVYLNSTGEWGQLDDLHYFLRRGIVNGSTIYVFINDFPLFLRHFTSLPKSVRVTVVVAMGDYGAPMELMTANSGRLQSKIPITISIRDFLADDRIHRLFVQNYDLVGCSAVAQSCSNLSANEIMRFEEKVIPIPIGVDLHTFAGRDMDESEFRAKACQQRLQLAVLASKAPPLAERQLAVVVSFDCTFEDIPNSYRTLGRRHLCDLIQQNNQLEETLTVDRGEGSSNENTNLKLNSTPSNAGAGAGVHHLSVISVVQQGEKGRMQFWRVLSSNVFAFAPIGKGLDTHRVWEILQLCTIPIVLTSPMDRLFKMFPIVIVESWDSLFNGGDKLLHELLKRIQLQFGENPFGEEVKERLSMSYWADLVDSGLSPS